MRAKFETAIAPYLDKIEAWAKDGVTAKDIAGALHISYSTFRKYLDKGRAGEERYRALAETFERACAVPDENVENSLYRRACGYQFEEITVEEKLDRDGVPHQLTKKVIRDIPPDPTSAMFWLTNRRRDRWSYRPDAQQDAEGDESGVVILPSVEGAGQMDEAPGSTQADEAGAADG